MASLEVCHFLSMLTKLAFFIMCCLFCHVVDDYYLQGCLANLKQKQWWKDNVIGSDPVKEKLYRYDYLAALFFHAFSWSFMIMVPLIFANSYKLRFYVIAVILNTLFHGFVDDLKANRKILNLIQDQFIHVVQIVTTCILWYCL